MKGQGLQRKPAILTALVAGCVAPRSGSAPEAQAKAAILTVATEAPAAALAETTRVASSPKLARSEATLAAASPAARGASPTATGSATTTLSGAATTLPTGQPSPSLTSSPSATATTTVLATATATATSSPAPTPVSAAEKLVATGVQVYKDQYCGICHQLGAARTGGLFGPPHDGIGTTAEGRVSEPGYSGVATAAEEYIRESIVDPKAFIVPGYVITSHPMPAYGFLDEEQILALVQVLLAQE